MVNYFILFPFLLQMILIGIDEFYFHRKRGLPQWERIGHPLDTLTVFICFVFLIFIPYSSSSLKMYVILALFSCLFITKDEFIHKECSPASEQWLHALLFLNHPVVLTIAGLMWPLASGASDVSWLSTEGFYPEFLRLILLMQAGSIFLFLIYQTLYWNRWWKKKVLE